MKVYISADIEGTAGIAHWDEAEKGKPGYDLHAEYMTGEVIAACEGALAAGASTANWPMPSSTSMPKGV